VPKVICFFELAINQTEIIINVAVGFLLEKVVITLENCNEKCKSGFKLSSSIKKPSRLSKRAWSKPSLLKSLLFY